MYTNKRGEILVFVVLVILVLASGFLIWQGAEITGAEVGIGEIGILATANHYQCGDVNSSINISANLVVNGTCFTIIASNLIIDGRGFNLTGNSSGSGAYMSGIGNITIKNFGKISNFSYGIYLNTAANLSVTNNTLINNNYGIYSDDINNSLFKNNNLLLSSTGIQITGYKNNITNNSISNSTNSAIYFEENSVSENNTINYNSLSYNGYGLYLTSYRTIINYNNFTHNNYGVYANNLYTSTVNGTNISYNDFADNGYNFYKSTNSLGLITLENNWWNTNDCGIIVQNISETNNLVFANIDPFLNGSYTNGNSTACPNQYCNMQLFGSKTLNGNLNCSGRGITIGPGNLTLDCLGYNINGSNSDSGIFFGTIYSGGGPAYRGNVTIKNCHINNFLRGIYSTYTHNVTVVNNTISGVGTGILLSVGSNQQIINNTIFNTNGTDSGFPTENIGGGIAIAYSAYNQITNNNLSNNRYAGIWEYSSYSSYQNNYLFNNSRGYLLYGSANNFTLDRMVNNTQAIVVNGTDQSLMSCLFVGSDLTGNTFDLKAVLSMQKSNLTFINTSINTSKLYVFSGVNAYFKNYLTINVTDSGQNPIVNVTVEIYNSLGSLEDSGLTNANGIATLKATQFYRTNEINYYLTPTTILAKKGNYTQNSTSINLYGFANNQFTLINLTLSSVTCGYNLTSNFIVGNNYHCSGAGFIIGADSLVINGTGFNLSGSGSNIGLDISGRKNITLANFNIFNFTTAINIYNSNSSTLMNLEVYNNSIGLIFNESNNLVIKDSSVLNNSIFNITATSTSETNNSLVNITTKNLNVSGSANLFVKWHVMVNATYNNGVALPNAYAYGYYNNTGLLEYSAMTNFNGLAELFLSEYKKNATGNYYLTPHNVTLLYSYLNTNITNSTLINLTTTNNAKVNLNLSLNCTSPALTNTLSSNTLFCPGTFTVDSVVIGSNNINITCISTIFTTNSGSSDSIGFKIESKFNIKIDGCQLENYGSGVYVSGSTNVNLVNLIINSNALGSRFFGVNCFNSPNLILNNSRLSNYVDAYLYKCNNSIFFKNVFENSDGIYLTSSNHGLFINNSFNSLANAVGFIIQDNPPFNNTFYYNNFSDCTRNIYYFNTTAYPNHQNYFNTSVNGYGQGNTYSDYCGKGSDLNGGGYADALSSATANDWPYNATTSTKIYPSTASITDYGPKMFSCPASEVYLGSGGSSSTTAVTAPAASVEAVNPAPTSGLKTTTEEPNQPEVFYNPAEAQEHLQTKTLETKTAEKITRVTIALENTGTKSMKLLPEIFQEVDDPYFIVTRKTLGYEDSLFSRLARISYSPEPVAGRLLKAEIINPEQIVLLPGEKIEKTLEIKEGLAIPRQIKVQFTTLGETVTEQEFKIQKKAVSGSAVDIDREKNLLDVYVLIVPTGLAETFEEYYGQETANSLTGGTVAQFRPQEEYLLELNINRQGGKKTVFSDVYGPYKIYQNQTLIFAQQLKYQPIFFKGDYLVRTRILKNGKTIVQNEFETKLE